MRRRFKETIFLSRLELNILLYDYGISSVTSVISSSTLRGY